MQKLNILVVEDGASQRKLLRGFLEEAGYSAAEAENGEQALEAVRQGFFDLLLVDFKMPGLDGLAVLAAVKRLNPQIDVIMMTAFGTVDAAVKAMKQGAADYLTKPIDLEELSILLERISEGRALKKEIAILREELHGKGVTTDQIIFKSAAMTELLNLAGRVAHSGATMLLQGESGTGKELLARLIHTLSPRSDKALVVVNCAALNENLLESELFGHEKGAYTGASRQRIGRFEEADGGTLFLDEIGELAPAIQVKLLRFLQGREFQRVGGNRTRHADVRIISATNRNLVQKVTEGTFREDLFFRVNVVAIQVPPLRERKEDIPLLIDHFLERFARQNGRAIHGVHPEAMDLLLKYDYPGNVRELENIIERAVVITRQGTITRRDLPFPGESAPAGRNESPVTGNLKASVEALERRLVQKAMVEAQHHQTRAADRLGISERMLRYKLKKYDLK